MTTTEATAYNYVRRGIAGTRAELARAMGISRPTASAVTDALISSGLLRDGGKGHSAGGRSPTLLVPCPEAFSLIGVDLNSSGRVFGVRINALGDVTGRTGGDAPPHSSEQAAEEILSLWQRLDPEYSALGIGIAFGRDDPDGRAVTKLLRRHLIGKYIHFAERLPAAALSEGFRGSTGTDRDYLFLSLESTLASVVCIGGRPFFGAHGAAGELCRLPFGIAQENEADSLAAECAVMLRNVLAVLDPGAVVISGRFSDMDGEFIRSLKRKLRMFDCRIVAAKFGEFSAARGAALQTHFSI